MRVKDTILLQNFVFFKISFAGELSDAELLQLSTYFESTERKSTLLTNEEVQIKKKQIDHMIKSLLTE